MSELRVLGAGSSLPRAGYGPSGYALVHGGEVTLLDCGPGSVRHLAQVEVPIQSIARVVLSHFHLDHCLDLFALAFARRNPALWTTPAPLSLHGPPGLERFVEGSVAGLGPGAADPDLGLHELSLDPDGRGEFSAGDLRFRCVRNGHTDVSLSWRVDASAGWSLVYTGDTNEDPAVVELARGADLLLAECSFPDSLATPNHLTPSSAARMARDAAVGRLLLTHFYPSLEPEQARERAAQVYDGPVACARDGSVHPLGR